MKLGKRLFCEDYITTNTLFKEFRKDLNSDYEWFDWRIHYQVRRDIGRRLYNMPLARSFESIKTNFKGLWW